MFLYVLFLLPFVYVLIPYSVKIKGKNNCVIYVLKIFLLYFISLKVKGSHNCLKEFILPQNILPIMMQKETIENKGLKLMNMDIFPVFFCFLNLYFFYLCFSITFFGAWFNLETTVIWSSDQAQNSFFNICA